MASGPRAPLARGWLTLEIVPDLLDEIGWQAGLRDESVTPGCTRPVPFGGERVRAESHDQEMARVRRRFQHSGRFPAIDTGERQIHQDEIRLQGPRLVNRFASVARGL